VAGWARQRRAQTRQAATPASFGARETPELGRRPLENIRLDGLQEGFDVARLLYSLNVLLKNRCVAFLSVPRRGRAKGRRRCPGPRQPQVIGRSRDESAPATVGAQLNDQQHHAPASKAPTP
jgi:hypothetical protein